MNNSNNSVLRIVENFTFLKKKQKTQQNSEIEKKERRDGRERIPCDTWSRRGDKVKRTYMDMRLNSFTKKMILELCLEGW